MTRPSECGTLRSGFSHSEWCLSGVAVLFVSFFPLSFPPPCQLTCVLDFVTQAGVEVQCVEVHDREVTSLKMGYKRGCLVSCSLDKTAKVCFVFCVCMCMSVSVCVCLCVCLCLCFVPVSVHLCKNLCLHVHWRVCVLAFVVRVVFA